MLRVAPPPSRFVRDVSLRPETHVTLNRRQFLAVALAPGLLGACSSERIAATEQPISDPTLEAWFASQRRLSSAHVLSNIAPAMTFQRDVEAKFIAPSRREIVSRGAAAAQPSIWLQGDRVRQQIVPRAGSVAAAPPGAPHEPDYFFHWVRDSALVMRALATLCATGPADQTAVYDERLAEFIHFSRSLQESAAPEGLGEVRFNMDGSQDFLLWNRPQFDGPALRALALMHYEDLRKEQLSKAVRTVLGEVVQADLDYIEVNWARPCFDLWEELKGHDFHARAVQAAALSAGIRRASSNEDQARAGRYEAARRGLHAAMHEHWLAERGYYGFFSGKTVDLEGVEQIKPGDNLDTAVLMAAVHARTTEGPYSLLDDRMLATAVKLEDFFSERYAFNHRLSANEGILYGRYQGDAYFGGNAWAFITLTVAEAYYRLAELIARGASLRLTPLNRSFLVRAMQRADQTVTESGDNALSLDALRMRRTFVAGLLLRGDDILRTIRRVSPTSGALPEQYDQESGAPASASNLSWSHAALLAATDARAAARAATTGRASSASGVM